MLWRFTHRAAFRRGRMFFLAGLFLFAASCACSLGQVDVLTQHNDNARTGSNFWSVSSCLRGNKPSGWVPAYASILICVWFL